MVWFQLLLLGSGETGLKLASLLDQNPVQTILAEIPLVDETKVVEKQLTFKGINWTINVLEFLALPVPDARTAREVSQNINSNDERASLWSNY